MTSRLRCVRRWLSYELKPRKDGAVMFVKSHSNNGSGGVNYIWNEDSLLPDDDGYIIKSETTDTGRWIADYGTSPITPQTLWG